MKCPHCNADLTKDEAVVRWWGSYGHYKPATSWEGGFVDTNSIRSDQNFYDACTSCGETISEKEVLENA